MSWVYFISSVKVSVLLFSFLISYEFGILVASIENNKTECFLEEYIVLYNISDKLMIECEVGLQAFYFLFGWLNTRIDSEDNAGS